MNLYFKKIFKKDYLFLCLILILGLVLRLEGVFTGSFAFTYDVGRDMLSLWSMVYDHKLSLIGPTTGIEGVFYGPWWYLILTPFFVIFNGNPQGIAFSMAVFGILTIILSYYFGKKISGSFLGLVLAFLISFSPILISLSSQIWNPNIAPLLVILTFIILERIYVLNKKSKSIYFFLLGFLLFLNIDVEILWGILFLIGIVFSILVILGRKIRIGHIIFFFVGGIIILLPRIIFELRHSFIMSKAFLRFFGKDTLEDKLDLYHFLENRFNTHLDQFSNVFFPQRNILEIFLLIFSIVVIILFYKKASVLIKNFILTSVITLLVFYIGSIIFTNALWPHYFVGLPILYIFLVSISLFIAYKRIKIKIIIFLILAMFFLINVNSFSIINNFQKPLWEGDASVYRNQLKVVDYIYKDANTQNFKYELYTPPVFDNTYQYLFKWYGNKQYGYLPVKKADIMYFIIEADPGYPDRPRWWLEAREGDGRVVSSKKLNGDIVVQKRTDLK